MQPAQHSSTASTATNIKVTYSQAISAASTPNARLYVAQGHGRTAATITGGGTATLTLDPADDFLAGERVSVVLPQTIRGTNGQSASPHIYQFWTVTGGSGRGGFADTTRLWLGGTRYGLATGDLDNDGDLDLINVDDGAFSVASIRFNDGTGHFPRYGSILAGGDAYGLTLADMNADGYLDVLITNWGISLGSMGMLHVCLNDQTGHFAQVAFGALTYNIGLDPMSVTAGDVDGDGDLDAVVANAAGNNVSIAFNSGNGVISSVQTVSVGAYPNKVGLGDVDNDGDLDLLTCLRDAAGVAINRNDGSGNFGTAARVAVGQQPIDLTVADFNGDGNLDFATSNAADGTLSVCQNSAASPGTFSALAPLSVAARVNQLVAGDIDADGDFDLIATAASANLVALYRNSGSGSFSLAAATPAFSPGPALLGDFDQDADLDLVTGGNTTLWRNVGTVPTLAILSFSPPMGSVGDSVTLNGVNFLNVSAVAFNGVSAPFRPRSQTRVRTVVPAGATTGRISLTATGGTVQSATDFVVVSRPTVLSVSPQRNAPSVAPAANPVATFSGPLDGATLGNLRVYGSLRGRYPGTAAGGSTATVTYDPASDFAPGEEISVSLPNALLSPGGGRLVPQMWQFRAAAGGTGQGNFTTVPFPAPNNVGQTAVGDFDGDGDADILVPAGSGASTVTLLRNNGTGTLTAAGTTSIPSSPVSIVAGDVDADGDLDFVISTYGGGYLGRNDGTGTFTLTATTSLGTNARFRLIDVDADGALDLMVFGGDGVATLVNNGTGTFTLQGYIGGFSQLKWAEMADMNADGSLDVVLIANRGTNIYTEYLYVYRRTGRGTYAVTDSVGAANTSGLRLCLGDLDADGAADVVLISTSFNTYPRNISRIYHNDGAGHLRFTDEAGPGGNWLADFDADGDLDLLGSPEWHRGPFSLTLNDGTGHFGAASIIGPPRITPGEPVIADFDGDHDLDFFYLTTGSGSLLLNQSAPAPLLTRLYPVSGPVGTTVDVAGQYLTGASAVRLNGQTVTFVVISDKLLRFTVPAGATSGLVVVTTPGGQGTSGTTFNVVVPLAVVSRTPAPNAPTAPVNTTIQATFSQPITAATADGLSATATVSGGKVTGSVTSNGATLTLDPAHDFAAGEKVRVLVPNTLTSAGGAQALPQQWEFTTATGGTGRGTRFRPGPGRNQSISTIGPTFNVGDITGDGYPDAVVQLWGAYAVARNVQGHLDSLRLYQASTSLVAPNTILYDIDSDGDLDVVNVYSAGQQGFFVNFLNDGRGNLTSQGVLTPCGFFPKHLTMGDLNADGYADLVTTSSLMLPADSIAVLLGSASGAYAQTAVFYPSIISGGAQLLDFDADGDLDILAPAEGRVLAWLNDGYARFGAAQTLLVTSREADFVAGDADGDGDVDLLVFTLQQAPATRTMYLARNNGAAGFQPEATIGTDVSTAQFGDLDADGDLDIVAGTETTKRLRVYLNNGNGQFPTLTTNELMSGPVRSIRAVDLDRDADLDIVLLTDSTGVDNWMVVRYNEDTAPPTITSFAPTAGLPGDTVLVTGAALLELTGLRFNGVAAQRFGAYSSTGAWALVPPGATTGRITATSPLGTGTSATDFVVLRPLVPVTRTPTAFALQAPANTPISVVLSEPVTAASSAGLQASATLSRGAVAGPAAHSGATLTLPPPALTYAPGEEVTVSLGGTAVQAIAPGARLVPQIWQFRVATGGTGRGIITGTNQTALTGASGVVTGDVDGDGDLDGVFSIRGDLAVALNPGNGILQTPALLTNGRRIDSHIMPDLDNDGDLDYVSYDSPANLLNLLFNDGTSAIAHDTAIRMKVDQLGAGDVDGDGDIDLLTVTRNGQAVTRYNDGNGVFSDSAAAQLVKLGGNGRFLIDDVKLHDIDGDGDLDALLQVSDNYYRLLIMLNLDGRGHFGQTRAALPSNNYHRFLYGDIDGDGDLDVVTTAYTGVASDPSTVRAYFNDGAGIFSGSSLVINILQRAHVVALGDVDADGDLDLVLAKPGSLGFLNTFDVMANDGTGAFPSSGLLHTGTLGNNNARTLHLVDLDGDADLDLLAYDDYSLVMRFNAPTPPQGLVFTPPQGVVGDTVRFTGRYLATTTSVSFNGVISNNITRRTAGSFAVVVPAGATTGRLTVTTTNGSTSTAGPFTVLRRVPMVSSTPPPNTQNVPWTSPFVATFSEPVAPGANGIRVYGRMSGGLVPGTLSGGGSGTLTWTPTRPFAFGELVNVTVPSTMAPVASGGRVTGSVTQFRVGVAGSGTGTFQVGTWQRSSARMTLSGVLGDLDGDRDLDLVTGHLYQSGIDIHYNSARGSFGAAVLQQAAGVPQVSDIALADLNADGALDILLVGTGSLGSLVVLRNLNNQRFAAPRALATTSGYGPAKVVTGDLDADGDIDVLSIGSGLVELLRNNGTGNFSPTAVQWLMPSSGQRMLAGAPVLQDLDGDYDLDVVLGFTSDSVVVGLNNGLGSFTPVHVVDPLNHFMSDFTSGDVDGDLDIDLAVTYSDSTMAILTNDGTGHFTVGRRFAGGNEVASLGLADFDADGDLDLLALDHNSNTRRLYWTNNGQGIFTLANTDLLQGWYHVQPLPLGDLDGDGDLDMMGIDGNRDLIEPWFNGGTGAMVGLPVEDVLPVVRALFPNPAHQQVTVVLPPLADRQPGARLRLTDALGRVVRETDIPTTATMLLDLQGVAPGIYAINFGGGASCRLVVQ